MPEIVRVKYNYKTSYLQIEFDLNMFDEIIDYNNRERLDELKL
jgi:hypothetical protein